MIKTLWPFLKPFKLQLIIGPIFKLIEAIFELLLPLCMARLIDEGIIQKQFHIVLQQSSMILLFSLLGLIAVFICQYMASIASQGFGTNLRAAIFKHTLTLSSQRKSEIGVSSLINRITNDTNQLQVAVAMLIRLVIRAPFLGIGAIIMAGFINFKLTLIFILSLPIFLFLLLWIMKKNLPAFKKLQATLDYFNETVIENIEGSKTIHSMNQTSLFYKNLVHKSNDIKLQAIKSGKISALMTPLTTLIINSAIAILLWVGGNLTHQNMLPVGDLVALVNYLSQMLLALIVISNLIVTFSKAESSAQRITTILSISDIDTQKGNSNIKECSNIQLKDVAYRYSKHTIIHHLATTISYGQSIAITGPMGSGKSTFLRLLIGELEPTHGQILIDSISRNTFTKKQYQSFFTYVPQKVILFKGTIRSNLKFANPDASDDELWKALEASESTFVKELPEGLDTPVEKMGTNFSGGQKQRLTLARALLKKDTHFLVLDDCFSALDFQTEACILKNIQHYYPNLTLINVSQRPQTLKQYQKVIVIEKGTISHIGNHEFLKTNNLFYKNLMEGSHE